MDIRQLLVLLKKSIQENSVSGLEELERASFII